MAWFEGNLSGFCGKVDPPWARVTPGWGGDISPRIWLVGFGIPGALEQRPGWGSGLSQQWGKWELEVGEKMQKRGTSVSWPPPPQLPRVGQRCLGEPTGFWVIFHDPSPPDWHQPQARCPRILAAERNLCATWASFSIWERRSAWQGPGSQHHSLPLDHCVTRDKPLPASESLFPFLSNARVGLSDP